MPMVVLQVFGFLLGIDLKGMSAGADGGDEDGEDQMRGMPTPPAATRAQSEAQQAQKEEEEEEVSGWILFLTCQLVWILWLLSMRSAMFSCPRVPQSIAFVA